MAGRALITGMIGNLDVDVVDGVLVPDPGEALTMDIGGSPPGGNGRGIGTNPPGPVAICGAGAVLTGIANSDDEIRTASMIVAMLRTKSCKEWRRLQQFGGQIRRLSGALAFMIPPEMLFTSNRVEC